MAQPLTMQQKAESNFCWPQQQQEEEQVQILAHNFQTSHNKQGEQQQQQQQEEKLVKSEVKCSEEIKNVRLQQC